MNILFHYIKIFLFSFLVVSLPALTSCRTKEKNNEMEHHHHHDSTTSHSDVEEDEHHEDGLIMISPAQIDKLGIKTSKITSVPFTEAIKVSAEVTTPPAGRKAITATKSGILTLNKNIVPGMKLNAGQSLGSISGTSLSGGDQIQNLKLEYEATKRELERVAPLYEQGIISAKDYNSTKLLFERAKSALGDYNTTSGGLTTPASGTLLSLLVNDGDYIETGQTLGYVGDNVRLTVKANLPKRYHGKLDKINDIFIIPSCDDCEGFRISDAGGKKIEGNSTISNEISGFIPVYFYFDNNGLVENGGYTEAYLLLNSFKETIAVPNSALVEQQGQWFVYVQIDEDCFEKRSVKPGGSNGSETEILSGINDGENIVTQGVSFVKLAETSGQVPEGHTHSH